MLKVERVDVENLNKDLMLFWNECFSNCKAINDVRFLVDNFVTWKEVLFLYGELPFLVSKCDGEYVGFFFEDFDKNSNAIGLSVYIPKLKFKKSLIVLNNVILCGFISDFRRFKTEKFKYIEFNTFSPSIVDLAIGLLPNLVITYIRKEYIVISGQTKYVDFGIASLINDDFVVLLEEKFFVVDLPKSISLEVNGKIKKMFFDGV